jgi:DNA-binding transcriptional ArsR family regulator
MVEYSFSLDNVFSALSDPTRRDMLQRLASAEFTVGQLAKNYDLTFAAVSKHLKVLEKARMIIKRKKGKEQIVSIAPQPLADASEYLDWYSRLWENRLDSLADYLEEDKYGQ